MFVKLTRIGLENLFATTKENMAIPTLETEADWRKRFKADLSVAVWQKITLDTGNYMVKSFFTPNSYEILLTDLSNYWYEKLSEHELNKRIQKLNPSIEAPVIKILDQIKNSITSPQLNKDCILEINLDKEATGQELCLFKINSTLAGMPFYWHFKCRPAHPDMTRDHLSVPLMAMVSELLRRQQELFSMIYKKDKELEDYKSQGVRPSRRNIVTPPFNAIGFFHNMNVSSGFEEEMRKKGMYVFNEMGSKLYETVMIKQAWINKSPLKRSADELEDIDSFNDEVIKQTSAPSWSNRLPPSMMESATTTTTTITSPHSSTHTTPESSPIKDELKRRQQLEKTLEEQEQRKHEKAKKKKKMAF